MELAGAAVQGGNNHAKTVLCERLSVAHDDLGELSHALAFDDAEFVWSFELAADYGFAIFDLDDGAVVGDDDVFGVHTEFDSKVCVQAELKVVAVLRHKEFWLDLAMDPRNPSSIYNALRSARENARAVRVAMTSETWENINSLWLEFNQFIGTDLAISGLHEFCDWVKSRSHLFRGVSYGTMLRDDAFRFLRLGTFIERSDNTARLLDVKYHLLQSEDEADNTPVDYYEWSAVLRSVSAFQAYQKVFNDTIEPLRVAELLILREDMPRSLHACFSEITPILEQLTGRRGGECKRMAGELHSRLRYGRMHDIFAEGLHGFLEDFILRNNNLGLEIQRTFLSANSV